MKTLIIIEAICAVIFATFGYIILGTDLFQGWMMTCMFVSFIVAWFAPDFCLYKKDDNN